MLLKGKRIFVTGGSRGIGASCVRICAENGAMVGFNYHSHEEEALSIEKELGGSCKSYKADVRDSDEMEGALFDFCNGKDLHGLVVNAGIYRRATFSDLDMDDWRRTMSVNLDGAFVTLKKGIELMENGSVAIISSQLAYKGSSHGGDYAASKAALIGLNASLAREFAPDIRFNALAPGYVDTDILASDTPEKRKKREREVPLGRLSSPDEVANVVLFLLSDLSSYMTGSVLDVNGGLFIH